MSEAVLTLKDSVGEQISKDFAIGEGIWELVEDEGEANKGYSRFLKQFGNRLSNVQIQKILEIISEEIKHISILKELAYEITGVKEEVD